jgi:hypothetical protein
MITRMSDKVVLRLFGRSRMSVLKLPCSEKLSLKQVGAIDNGLLLL